MTKKLLSPIFSVICFCSFVGLTAFAQSPSPSPSPLPLPNQTPGASATPKPKGYPPCPNPKTKSSKDPTKDVSIESQFIKNILKDQCVIWTSPARLSPDEAKVIIPIGAITAVMMTQDSRVSSHVGTRGTLPPLSRAVSELGAAYSLGGTAAAFYLIGHATKNERAKETGVLAAQALINTTIVTKVIKAAMRRDRPDFGDGKGRFFNEGESFFSGHSSKVWSVATVIAYEYKDKPIVRYAAFATAAAVALSRFSARRHFLSDILIGSAVGFYIGRYVYCAHNRENKDECKSKSNTITKITSRIAPLYDSRTRTYGGRFVLDF